MEKQTLTEHQIQYNIHDLLSKYGVIHFETDVMDALKFFGNNERARFSYIGHHKKMGYMKGQPDLIVLCSGKVFFVELKTQKGVQTKEQKQIEMLLKANGYNYEIWRSVEDCAGFILREKHK